MTRNVQILDTTLREGIQAVHPTYPLRGIVFTKKQSQSIAKLLFHFGIDYLEVGSPVCSPQSKDTISSIIKMSRNYKTKVLIHCRLLESDAEEALSCKPDGLNFYFNSSSFSKHTPEEIIAKAISVFSFVRTKSKTVSIRFSFEDAFRTPYPVMKEIIVKLSSHVERFGFPDTTGLSSPEQVNTLIKQLTHDFPSLISEFHFHNDRGLATANARAALMAGASIIDTTILGLGERNGIVSLASLISALLADNEYHDLILKKYNLTSLFALYQYMSKILKTPIHNSEPIVSLGYFVQSAGVHVNGNQITNHMYESYNPHDFGLEQRFCWASGVVGKTNMILRAQDLGIKIDTLSAQQLAASIRETAKLKGSIKPSYVDRKIKQLSE